MRITHHRGVIVMATVGTAAAVFFALPVSLAVASIRLQRAIQLRLPLDSVSHGFRGILDAMDCVRAGYCTAGGAYFDRQQNPTPMVATESAGHWARATKLTMPANAAGSSFGGVTSVQCAAAGSCVAAGYYDTGQASFHSYSFEATETRGRWARAHDIAPPQGGVNPQIYSISCYAPRSCVAAGGYSRGGANYFPMQVTEVNGKWQPARALRLPGPGEVGTISSVSCVRRGFCAAVGGLDGADSSPTFAVTESHGRWQRAFTIRLPKGARQSASDGLASISCTAIGSCTAAGVYDNASGTALAPMTVTESDGTWARARAVNVLPGNDNRQDDSVFDSISCVHAGSCVALGRYTTKVGRDALMISVESAGKWRSSTEIVPPPNGGAAAPPYTYLLPAFGAVDCASASYCAAGSLYADSSGNYDALTVAARLR